MYTRTSPRTDVMSCHDAVTSKCSNLFRWLKKHEIEQGAFLKPHTAFYTRSRNLLPSIISCHRAVRAPTKRCWLPQTTIRHKTHGVLLGVALNLGGSWGAVYVKKSIEPDGGCWIMYVQHPPSGSIWSLYNDYDAVFASCSVTTGDFKAVNSRCHLKIFEEGIELHGRFIFESSHWKNHPP